MLSANNAFFQQLIHLANKLEWQKSGLLHWIPPLLSPRSTRPSPWLVVTAVLGNRANLNPPPQFNLADRSYGNELVGQRKGCAMRGMDGWEGGVEVPLFTSGTPRPSCPPCPQPLLLLSLSYWGTSSDCEGFLVKNVISCRRRWLGGGSVCMHRDRSKVTTIEDGEWKEWWGVGGWTGTGYGPF